MSGVYYSIISLLLGLSLTVIAGVFLYAVRVEVPEGEWRKLYNAISIFIVLLILFITMFYLFSSS
ncbi:hypothetical protein [Alteribacillus bidgolensis]|uniref:hypothetical protein n=1 Tax=Alteribacillus bidgolensis TaxID=930129 RepID=UPI00147303EC|nr:hypothetical protein [Alteribacillus bidgolensis]